MYGLPHPRNPAQELAKLVTVRLEVCVFSKKVPNIFESETEDLQRKRDNNVSLPRTEVSVQSGKRSMQCCHADPCATFPPTKT